MNNHFFELSKPEHAYMFGFMQTDGTLYGSIDHKGKFSLELSYRDIDILKKISECLICNYSIRERTRKTNFSDLAHTAVLTVSDMSFRRELVYLGMPVGKKDMITDIPKVSFSKPDYFRGVVDANGSLGITRKGIPFLSLTTKSDAICSAYCSYIEEVTGKVKTVNRNKRDNIFNICLFIEEAKLFSSVLYYRNCLTLDRKYQLAKDLRNWSRSADFKKIDFEKKRWDACSDSYIRTHTIQDSVLALRRTEKSIKVRLWRLSTGND